MNVKQMMENINKLVIKQHIKLFNDFGLGKIIEQYFTLLYNVSCNKIQNQ